VSPGQAGAHPDPSLPFHSAENITLPLVAASVAVGEGIFVSVGLGVKEGVVVSVDVGIKVGVSVRAGVAVDVGIRAVAVANITSG